MKSENTLFRAEAAHANRGPSGDILITVKSGTRWVVLLMLGIVLAAAGFLVTGTYARKATVQGYLEPGQGISEVRLGREGRVIERLVRAGDSVKQHQPLIRIARETYSGRGLSIVDARRKRTLERIDELDRQLAFDLKLSATRIGQGETRLAALVVREQDIRKELVLTAGAIELAAGQRDRLTLARVSRVVPEPRRLEAEVMLLSAERAHLQLKRQLEDVLVEQQSISASTELEQLGTKKRRSEHRMGVMEYNERLLDIDAIAGELVTAPVDGVIVILPVRVGQFVAAGELVAGLAGPDEKLTALLLVPDTAVGFIEVGQSVEMSFDAFPQATYGKLHGAVTELLSTAIVPFSVRVGSRANKADYFKVRVEMDTQAVNAYGQKFPLRSGMAFRADITLANRSLVAWLLDPLYAVTG